ncbi:MAG: cation diffusion facilitator family transporter [Eubacteriales bacterium]|nr:cation diffusion facilitator family transporter [Eubacteriales bacterium]
MEKLFVDSKGTTLEQRRQYGRMTSTVGIVVNVCLSALKIFFGILTGSIAILSDGFNNLSDITSSVVSLLSFHISAKPADEDHPYGHARFEYISSAFVGTLIIWVGLSIGKEAIHKIIEPAELEFGLNALIILFISIGVKFWLYFFYRNIGNKVNSELILATAEDSRADVLATSGIVIALIVYKLTNVNLDAPMALVVSVIILKSGWDVLMTAFNHIMGVPASPELIEQVREFILSHQGIKGAHDIIVHDYGPGKKFVTAHLEVDEKQDLADTHDLAEQIAHELEDRGIQITTYIEPVSASTKEVRDLRENIVKLIVVNYGKNFQIHHFRTIYGYDKDTILFVVSVPLSEQRSNTDLKQELTGMLETAFPDYHFLITIERNFKD